MAWLFGITLFVSALLLFVVQPMIAKMLLPLLGGAPAVWNTCLVFFQAVLLGGYAYAHWVTVRLPKRRQFLLHFALLLLAVLVLPFGVAEPSIRVLSGGVNPSLWVLGCLTTVVGLPFFVVSTTSPLLQRWFSGTRHPSARDPYFLYAASNSGSLLVLIIYPILLEPHLRLREQSRVWAFGYGLLIVLILACAVLARRNQNTITEPTGVSADAEPRARTPEACMDGGHPWKRRLHWVLLAFVPSSLMLGVTNYLTADIASIPLLWVVPLALYLVTFILSFARRKLVPLRWLTRTVPIGALALTFLILSRATQPVWLLIAVHLAFLWMAGMMCH